MSKLSPLYLLLSFGLAFGTNHVLRPRLNYELAPGERTLITGALHFDESAASVELKLATIHVFTGEIKRPFSDAVAVRELWLRSPEQDAQTAPDLELFMDLPPSEAHEIQTLEKRELKIRSAAPASTLRSRVRLPGSDHHSFVSDGKLVLEEILPSDAPGSFRVEGRIEMFVPDASGERRLSGRLSARVVAD